MDCDSFQFTGHSIRRLFERQINEKETILAVKNGEIIAVYPDDKPYPTYLILAFVHTRPLHVVVALDKKKKRCYIVTIYEPDRKIWNSNFKSRRKG